MGAIVARQDNFHKTSLMGRLHIFQDERDVKFMVIAPFTIF
ncbi:N-acetylglucosamine-regulated outer membrane porin [Shigella boydii ATCC 9905]|nr:N-acetylglucosamine-regulated outer membrane porin [Shigella boydii ATCC 9905]